MAKTLQRFVTVNNPDTNETFTFEPGDVLPPWAEQQITNPKAFTVPPEARLINDDDDSHGFFTKDSVQQKMPNE